MRAIGLAGDVLEVKLEAKGLGHLHDGGEAGIAVSGERPVRLKRCAHQNGAL